MKKIPQVDEIFDNVEKARIETLTVILTFIDTQLIPRAVVKIGEFGDEVSFGIKGSLARTRAHRGKQPVVKTTGIQTGLKMFGAIELLVIGGYMESLAYSREERENNIRR